MRVLVTGGAGYIGSHTVRALIEAKHEPVVIDNLVYGHKKVIQNIFKTPLICGNIGNTNLLKSVIFGTHNELISTNHEGKMIDAIIHFAAYAYVGESVKQPLKYYKNNVSESINLLDIICSNDVISRRSSSDPIPIIFSSSCATYGIPKETPITENTPQNPINPYGKSKLMVEEIIKDLAISCNLKSVILRYFNAAGASPDSVIGEDHCPETHLIPLAIKAAFESKPLKIFGDDYPTFDGTCLRDYIHVCDLANAHVLALKIFEKKQVHLKHDYKNNDLCKIYNLGNGSGISVKQIINIIEKVTQKEIKIIIEKRREGDPTSLIASASKIIQELGWEPKYPNIYDIVSHSISWYTKSSFQ